MSTLWMIAVTGLAVAGLLALIFVLLWIWVTVDWMNRGSH